MPPQKLSCGQMECPSTAYGAGLSPVASKTSNRACGLTEPIATRPLDWIIGESPTTVADVNCGIVLGVPLPVILCADTEDIQITLKQTGISFTLPPSGIPVSIADVTSRMLPQQAWRLSRYGIVYLPSWLYHPSSRRSSIAVYGYDSDDHSQERPSFPGSDGCRRIVGLSTIIGAR